MIRTLVLTGEGINSHKETARAFQKAGSEVDFITIEEFLRLKSFDLWDIITFPGGFSYGDEIRSGKLLAQKINLHQKENLKKFISQKKPILGICNGFQILVQLGVFEKKQRTITLAQNQHNKFINKWTKLRVDKENKSFWLKEIDNLHMPVRHKEGRLKATKNITDFKIAFSYDEDINGSFQKVAGITNEEGNILGLMPHPEAAIDPELFMGSHHMAIQNQILFKNAIEYSKGLRNEKSVN